MAQGGAEVGPEAPPGELEAAGHGDEGAGGQPPVHLPRALDPLAHAHLHLLPRLAGPLPPQAEAHAARSRAVRRHHVPWGVLVVLVVLVVVVVIMTVVEVPASVAVSVVVRGACTVCSNFISDT